ncbi:Indoleamine 2,3-dioxygenase 2 [Paramuricea clavata]|uniref:Indoleamine 2,3-dioxygenase 2 n=2 Tax=Paramuricea clavata TaxID=317549 RepID=A0A6S7INN2_PARCT|nr:Indoleamine 2,3-dioxygenase 2 [Paramuricea clavata]
MALLDHNNLGDEREWGRAFTVLSAITHGYVWQNGGNNPAKMIPKCLAVPLVAAAKHIGGCPVVSWWPSMLNNWKIKYETRPLDLRNVEMQSLYTGSKDERWFFLIHWQIEIQSVPAIKSVVAAHKAVLDDNPELLRACLTTIQKTFQIMKTSLKRIYEHCDPAFFYTKLRVFLSGWKNSKSLPDGIIYEGVSTKPLKFSGASGSQSTTFHVFDAVLGIVHSRKGMTLRDPEKKSIHSR